MRLGKKTLKVDKKRMEGLQEKRGKNEKLCKGGGGGGGGKNETGQSVNPMETIVNIYQEAATIKTKE